MPYKVTPLLQMEIRKFSAVSIRGWKQSSRQQQTSCDFKHSAKRTI